MSIATTSTFISNKKLSLPRYIFILCIIYSIFVSIPLTNAGPMFSNCPNSCSFQGMCSSQTDVDVVENKAKTNTTTTIHRQGGALGICNCFPGFHGVDCSIRLCPSGTAWVDFPSSTNIAHAPFTECSNMGSCNRTSGICECNFGYYGPACDVMRYDIYLLFHHYYNYYLDHFFVILMYLIYIVVRLVKFHHLKLKVVI
jgi:hypothetical protein